MHPLLSPPLKRNSAWKFPGKVSGTTSPEKWIEFLMRVSSAKDAKCILNLATNVSGTNET
eukprot:2090416-Rhodomonas_salina.1